MLHTTEVMAISLIFWPTLAKIWLPWQRPLNSYNEKCLLWIARPWKPPVISKLILVISRKNSFICIYINFSPKIGCYGNAPLTCVYGSVTDEFPDSMNLMWKPNSSWIEAYNWSCGHFVIFLHILAKNWSPWQRPLDPCNQECLLWIGRPGKPRYK